MSAAAASGSPRSAARSTAGPGTSMPAHGVTTAADAGVASGSDTAEASSTAPVPPTSLSSLLGADFGAGAACAADGTCD